MEYNIGNAFNRNTGKFTCSHDGIYSFYATAHVGGRGSGDIQIYVNGSSKVLHYSEGTDNRSPYCVLKLKKGDTVHISMHGKFYRANSECTRTYFQGHLIDLL